MQSYPRSATVESRKEESPQQPPQHGDTGRSRVMVGGMVLALAAAVTAGVVLTARHNGWGANARPGERPAVVSAAHTDDSAAQPAASGAVISYPNRLPAPATVYLTSDAVAAGAARAELDAAVVAARTGQAPSSIVTVVPPGEVAQAFQTIADENRTRPSLNLPEIAVVDLRSSSTGPTAAAVLALRAIADENSLRVSLGLPEIAVPAAQ